MFLFSLGVGGRKAKIGSKPRRVCKPLHCHHGKKDYRPILPRTMCQLLDNVQHKLSWITALQKSVCLSNEDGLISIYLTQAESVVRVFSVVTAFSSQLSQSDLKKL